MIASRGFIENLPHEKIFSLNQPVNNINNLGCCPCVSQCVFVVAAAVFCNKLTLFIGFYNSRNMISHSDINNIILMNASSTKRSEHFPLVTCQVECMRMVIKCIGIYFTFSWGSLTLQYDEILSQSYSKYVCPISLWL